MRVCVCVCEYVSVCVCVCAIVCLHVCKRECVLCVTEHSPACFQRPSAGHCMLSYIDSSHALCGFSKSSVPV